MTRILALLATLLTMTACTNLNPSQPPEDLGEFHLGHNIVVASKMRQGPISRDATEQEWVDVLTEAVDRRFGGFEGDQLYHFGMSVEGYMLAPKGVPLIYNPRSMLIINLTVWDDAAGEKLNEKTETFQVLEDTTAETAIGGSGRNRTKEQQMQGLAENAMDQIGKWLAEQHRENGWFDKRPEATEKPAAGAAAVNPDTEASNA
ncbi:hypothetical protein [Pontibaca salina]|uniref:DUF4136 domain-containing protein n=1 Tax=Pontibaca salina TaxID=2795731 RepID=A0A934LY02_9RHOB|nr:hypothetical protein [Pontibaca salina]MBI6629217.1 hypothetical protein [Pontibaca salina]